MIYLEYSPWVVDDGHISAPLCCMKRKSDSDPFKGSRLKASLAERIFEVRGNLTIDLKNRSGIFERRYISDEDKIVLALRAVLI